MSDADPDNDGDIDSTSEGSVPPRSTVGFAVVMPSHYQPKMPTHMKAYAKGSVKPENKKRKHK